MKQVKRQFCGLYSTGGRLDGEGGPRYLAARLRCKAWTCPKCGPRRAKRLRRAIVEQAEAQGLNIFLTLTMDPKKGTAAESWPRIKDTWKKFQVYLGRRYGKGVKFLWVLEAQKSGYAHLHILLDRFVPQAWIKHAWDDLGGGRIVFIERANVQKAGRYLAKYLTKGFDEGLKRGQRRYGSSRGVNLKGGGGVKQGAWLMVKAPLEVLRRRVEGFVTGEVRDLEGVLEGFESSISSIYIPLGDACPVKGLPY